jgi:hypothetical protein
VPDPFALCSAVPDLARQLLHVTTTADATPTAATAAVRLTYQLITTQLHAPSATDTLGELPREISSRTAKEATAPGLCEYWLSCDIGLAQHMLQRLLQYAVSLVTSTVDNDSSADISGLTLQMVRKLPCSAFHGVVPTLSSVAVQLAASEVHTNTDSALDTLWCAVLEGVAKEGICGCWENLQQPSASAVPGTEATIAAPETLSTLAQALLAKHDSVLEILQSATAITQARCPVGSSSELSKRVQDTTMFLFPTAVAAFTGTGTDGLAKLEEVAEFAQRSGW